MRNEWIYAACGLAAYLVGAVPFGLLIARARGVDIRAAGSRNIGATNVFRCVGKPWGVLTFACDFLKGLLPALVLPMVVAGRLGDGGDRALGVWCGCLAVVGHNWPVYAGFKGGKGVATSAGALLGIAPAGMGIGAAAWAIVFLTTRYVSLASMAAAAVLGVVAWFLYYPDGLSTPFALTALAVMAVWRHKTNVRRLIDGTEHRFDLRKDTGSGARDG